MRPIKRGPIPLLANGKPKVVVDYKDWRFDLISRLGYYCCYCNMPLHDSPQVEHVVPKTPIPSLKLEWHNMLLACGPCNRAKSDTLCPPFTHLLPDKHNTYLAFTHQVLPHPVLPMRLACVVTIRSGLPPIAQWKAEATLSLCGLDVIPTGEEQIARASDLRWAYRYDTWLLADRYRGRWNGLPLEYVAAFLEILTEIALAQGFFSVWFDAFHDVPAVKEALVRAFLNTAACFPAPTFDPVPRIHGDL